MDCRTVCIPCFKVFQVGETFTETSWSWFDVLFPQICFPLNMLFGKVLNASLSLGQVRVLYVSSIAYAWSRWGACRFEEGELWFLHCLKHQPTQGAWNSEKQPFMSDVSIGWHTSQSLKLGECLRIFEKGDGKFFVLLCVSTLSGFGCICRK